MSEPLAERSFGPATVLFGADGGSGDDDEDGDATPIFGDRKKKK